MTRLMTMVVVLSAATAFAQYTNTLTGGQFSSAYAANADFYRVQLQRNQQFQLLMAMKRTRAQADAQLAKQQAKPAAQPKFPLSATDFKPAGARKVPEQLAAGVQNAEERAQLVSACRQILTTLEGLPDLRKNNLATSLAVLLGTSLEAVSGSQLTAAESTELLNGINDALAGEPGFKKLSAKERTVASDTFLITGGLIAGLAEEGKNGDAERAALAKDLATQVLAQFGAAKP